MRKFKIFIKFIIIIMLSELVDNNTTDKNTGHSYLDLYQELLFSKKETAQNVLEIGIGEWPGQKSGGSIKLWRDFFTNATVYALDINHVNTVMDDLKTDNRVVLYTSTDAYNENFFNTNFLNKNMKFDFMLDDGPHTLNSMKIFINLYSKIMAEDGILIIEDVQSIDWLDELTKVVPEDLKQYVKTYDLRPIKNRYDDIVFTINKSKQ